MRPMMRNSSIPLAAAALSFAACGEETGPSNAAPAAAFAVHCESAVCTFTNSSTDADGTIETYAWDFGDESPHGGTRNARHAYAAPGRYQVTLTVTDDAGDTAAATAAVDVSESLTEPTAKFTFTCSYLTCSFIDRSFAGAPGTSVMVRNWDFGDGSDPAAVPQPSHTYEAPGAFTVRLTVYDGYGTSATTTTLVDLTDPNFPPSAEFRVECTELTCAFSETSTDPDGSVASYAWDFGDGITSTERSPEHTFASASKYTVTLEVTDDRGATGETWRIVFVPPPVFDFVASCSGFECSFTPLVPAEWYIGWHWDFGDGHINTTDWNAAHTYEANEATTFTVTLNLMDEFLEGGTISHQVTVTP